MQYNRSRNPDPNRFAPDEQSAFTKPMKFPLLALMAAIAVLWVLFQIVTKFLPG